MEEYKVVDMWEETKKLIIELESEIFVARAKIEGIKALYDRLIKAESSSKSTGTSEGTASEN